MSIVFQHSIEIFFYNKLAISTNKLNLTNLIECGIIKNILIILIIGNIQNGESKQFNSGKD